MKTETVYSRGKVGCIYTLPKVLENASKEKTCPEPSPWNSPFDKNSNRINHKSLETSRLSLFHHLL